MVTSESCSCKFGRTLSKYNILSLEEELRRQWQSSEGPGLRSLADTFNQKALDAALKGNGEILLDGEVENLYRLLMNDEVSAGSYIQARNRLQKQGINPESIKEDFVSYQTINRHFKNCRNLDRETEDDTPSKRLKDRIFALQNRTVRVTEKTLNQKSGLQFETTNVIVDITVTCEECGTAVSVEEAIDGASCACSE